MKDNYSMDFIALHVWSYCCTPTVCMSPISHIKLKSI